MNTITLPFLGIVNGFMFQIKDVYMFPVYQYNSVAIVTPIKVLDPLQKEKDYVFVTKDESAFLRRFIKIDKENCFVKITNTAIAGRTIKIPIKEIKEVYSVEYIISKTNN